MRDDPHARPPNRQRRLQQRSTVTRQQLVTATLDQIFEAGFHGATTEEIARRAKVSRGALLHHFPLRSDIILAAMEELLADGTEQIRSGTEAFSSGEIDLDGVVDLLWRLFSGRFFYLSLEMIVQARSDPNLRERMIPVVKRFHSALDDLWAGLDDHAAELPDHARLILNMTVCLMRGMGVQTVLRPDPAYYADLIQAWKSLLPQLISGKASITSRPT